ncbi:NAD(P)-dependent oxidoreductase [Sphingobacterium psychroaquaticum]|uniref:D-3-phosphoglycerate dehydrogenase n=1 Tax=Sphingobacterium psychroaquaticum TaxID=561061 RepID=A0A1X7IDD8_9SPHI|nr:NAD(P)-dependent oxidoreductase [Sphingobacterium psychroaquaticum]SMG12157.1 D-3-phosphoglycerate dehydrogenase [Sphingobacterium psychroaquaticum]
MKVLLTAPYENEKALNELKGLFDEVIYRSWKPQGRAYNPDELTTLLKETGADALISEHDEITADVLYANPHLKFVGICRGTPSNIDLAVATELGIPVFNTPARNAQAVAEMFIANVVTLLRNTIPAVNWLAGKNWGVGAHTSYLQFKGNELAGKKVGMVGFGAVGQHIARMLVSFPCEIYYFDPYYTAPEQDFKKVELEELFATCDVVGIHLPVTPETQGMIDHRYLSLLHQDAIFVNTARASVVNRNDLLASIEQGKIRGAVLDVFYNEPPDEVDYKMILNKNVLATPHIAGATHEVEDHHAFIMNNNLREFFHNGNRSIKQLVNKTVLDKTPIN